MKPGTLWPFVIAGALVLHVAAMMVMVWISTSDESYAVEPDYYQKALEWDDKRAQDRHNAELGWRLEFTVEPRPAGQDPIMRVELTGLDGGPVANATISVETFANARRDDVLTAVLAESETGYRTSLPMRRNGLWEFRFTVTRGGELFTHSETRHIWTALEAGR